LLWRPESCIFSPQTPEEAKVVVKRYNDFVALLNKKDFKTAYSYTSPNYRQTHSLIEFQSASGIFSSNWETGDSLEICGDKATLHPHKYDSKLFDGKVIRLVKTSGEVTSLVKMNGVWFIDSFFFYVD
jgi:hypothetical protein